MESVRLVFTIAAQFNMKLKQFDITVQQTVSLSTTEAELKAACQGIKESVWLQQSLSELLSRQLPITQHIDNQAAIKIIDNETISTRTKHLDIQYKYILETRRSNNITTKYVNTDQQLADILTKTLSKTKFVSMRNQILWLVSILAIAMNVSYAQVLKQESSILWKRTDKIV